MQIKKFFHRLCLPSALGLAAALTACGGGGDSGGQGTLSVSMTDAPACGYGHVYVTVSKVRVHKSGSAAETDGGWQDIVVPNGPQKIDLLNLTNGALTALGTTTLPAGHYTQVRLMLASNGSGMPANSVVLDGDATNTEIPVTTPSALQSGIKLIHEFDVAANAQADLVLDFDACKSIVTQGKGTGSVRYSLKPVIGVIPKLTSGGITGYVTPGLTRPVVTAQQDGVVIRATVPDSSTGKFDLSPLPASTSNYVVVLSAAGNTMAAVTGVPVTAGSVTSLSTSTAPINLPATNLTRLISGTVTPASAQALVRATQTYSNGPKVEVAFGLADLASGAYSMSVPAAAPLLGAYSTTQPIALNPDTASAGKYSAEALATGYVASPVSVDVSGADATANFTLTPTP